MKVSEFFLTIYFWSLSAICLLVTSITCLILYPFIDQKTFARVYEIMTGYVMLYLMIIPGFWSLKIIDHRKDKSWDNKRFVIIANHVSFVDSMFLNLIGVKKKFMIAKIFTKIPIFGWLTKNAGFIPVDKNDRNTTYDAVDRAINSINLDNSSLAIFPEGMRSLKPYNLCDFKTGAFRIARQTNIPILPITFNGTAKAMRIGGIVDFAEITMTIDDSFFVENENYSSYIEKVKARMLLNLVDVL